VVEDDGFFMDRLQVGGDGEAFCSMLGHVLPVDGKRFVHFNPEDERSKPIYEAGIAAGWGLVDPREAQGRDQVGDREGPVHWVSLASRQQEYGGHGARICTGGVPAVDRGLPRCFFMTKG
jgi:hypothetical protein